MSDESFDQDGEEIIYVSKSEMKRDMLALQKLGESIVKLSEGQFITIPIEDETLAEAIHTARRIKHKEGLRRQMQYIGKLLRKIDTGKIEEAYQILQEGHKAKTRKFHQLEQWRDHIIEQGPNGVEEIMSKHPDADRQHLRQLVLQAKREQQNNKPPASSRKLFKYLRELEE